MNEDRYKLNYPHRMQETTKKTGRPIGTTGRPRKKPFHFDNSAIFGEYILNYNHNITRTGHCMRHCTRCGVGIRLMFYKVYYFRYYDGPCLCRRCKEIEAERKAQPKAARLTGTGFRINVPDGIVTHSGFDSLTIVGRIT